MSGVSRFLYEIEAGWAGQFISCRMVSMRRNLRNFFLLVLFFLTACSPSSNTISLAAGVPSPTPFQPETIESPYDGPAPTPFYLPTLTPPPAGSAENSVPPEFLPGGMIPPASGGLNPLTGMPPSDPGLLSRRPLAIKVANYPRYIRPQSGLTRADHVFEYYIEGGLTRFIAVFYGNDSEWVGPVRSGRYFDENIQRMYQSFLVFKFADPRVLDYFKESDFSQYIVVPGNGSCPPFEFLPTRSIEAYNNSYFYSPGWEDCITSGQLDNNPPIFQSGFFNELTPISDLQAAKIVTYYSYDSYNYWEYDPNAKQYLRYQETHDNRNGKAEEFQPLTDNVTGGQVHASNVVVLLAEHTFANTYDQEDEVYHIDLNSSGDAYVFRDGVAIPAHWSRTNDNQPLMLTGTDNSLIYMRPGITFYEVIGTHSFMDQVNGEWYFHHDTP